MSFMIFILAYFLQKGFYRLAEIFPDILRNKCRLIETTFIFSYFRQRDKCYNIKLISNVLTFYHLTKGFCIAFGIKGIAVKFEVDDRISHLCLVCKGCNTGNAGRCHNFFRHFREISETFFTLCHVKFYCFPAVRAFIWKEK